jgi:hypothetical protein
VSYSNETPSIASQVESFQEANSFCFRMRQHDYIHTLHCM